MHAIKLGGLAAILAIAAITMVGVGGAAASASLCKVNTNPCPESSLFPVHTTILELSSEVVLSGSLSVKCHIEMTLLVLGRFLLFLIKDITLLHWTACSGGCSSATTTALPKGSLTPTGGGNGTFNTESKLEVEFKGCLGFATCKMTASEMKFGFKGGAIGGTAASTATNIPVSLSGFGCGSSGTLNAGGGSGGAPIVVTAVNGSATGSIFAEKE
jgi:hypothetical protein